MEPIKMPSKVEREKQDKLTALIKENTHGMTIKQVNLYIEHLKNKMKDEK